MMPVWLPPTNPLQSDLSPRKVPIEQNFIYLVEFQELLKVILFNKIFYLIGIRHAKSIVQVSQPNDHTEDQEVNEQKEPLLA